MLDWCKLVYRVSFPTEAGQVAEYLSERGAEPCSRTLPQALLASLAFIECGGGVLEPDRLSRNPILKNSVGELTSRLSAGLWGRRKAPPPLLIMVVYLEILVTEGKGPASAGLRVVQVAAHLGLPALRGHAQPQPGLALPRREGAEGLLQQDQDHGAL